MAKRIIIADIARATKLHVSTVSRALQNHPRLSPTTRSRVQETAKKLGYIPDPLLSSLAAYRRTVRPLTYQANLAWITSGPTSDWWLGMETYVDFYEGARSRAEEFGYKLELFWIRESVISSKRASHMLKTRNISGLFLAPQFRACAHLNLDWANFSAVAIGQSLAFPTLHRVSPNQFRAAKTIVRKLRAYGYRRIGLSFCGKLDERVDHSWSGGYLTEHFKLFREELMPPFLFGNLKEKKTEDSFWKWFKKYRPQVIITCSGDLAELFKKRGYRIPRDISLVYLSLVKDSPDAGICEAFYAVGAAAADLLISMLNRNEKGIPVMPQRILIEGSWRDGATLTNRLPSKDISGVCSSAG